MSTGQIQISIPQKSKLHVNEYVTFTTDGRKHISARYYKIFSKNLSPLKAYPYFLISYSSRPNLGQLCLLDALLAPSISLVTCYGIAGTNR
jgi:PhoH-like ATPase